MDQHDSLDRLLERATAPSDRATPVGGCLDADTLAAWADGSLGSGERSVAETHAADCDRCLAMLAAMARTTPPPEVPARPAWFPLRWLVPLGAAAVAVLAWVLIPAPELSRPSPQPAAVPAETAQATPARKSAGVTPPGASSQAAATDSRAVARRDQATSLLPHQQVAKEAPLANAQRKAVTQPETAESELRDRVAGRGAGDAGRGGTSTRADTAVAAAAPPPPPPPAAPPMVRREETATAERAGPQPAPPMPAAEPTPSGAGARAEQLRFPSARPFAAASFIVRSPQAAMQWRVAGMSVERSTDDGRTWQPQATGTTAELLAGASPQPRVAWLVGRNGTVLHTATGEAWQALAFPDRGVDLVSVSARDADTATVMSAAGRTYQTTDRGRTWTVQEDPARAGMPGAAPDFPPRGGIAGEAHRTRSTSHAKHVAREAHRTWARRT